MISGTDSRFSYKKFYYYWVLKQSTLSHSLGDFAFVEWEGGDEWIRAQFKEYLQSLMASVLADGKNT